MTKQQQLKKKQREREVSAKLQRRRAAKIKADKYERDIMKDVRANRPKGQTIRAPRTPEEVTARDAKIMTQLEHNMKILKALEEEYDKEVANRQKIHEDLEAEGHLTPQEKIKAIADRARVESEKLETQNLLPEGVEVVLNLENPEKIKEDLSLLKVESSLEVET